MLMLLATLESVAGIRVTELRDWDFKLATDSVWKKVRTPHDWAISGPFDKDIDKQIVAIEQNGEKVATEKTGRSGALPWIGEGTYKTNVSIPEIDDGKTNINVELLFDGVMSEPVVFVNGKKVGEWKLGYNAFKLDITQFLIAGENEIKVQCRNRAESSRWYPGAGIYRPVKLIVRKDEYIPTWATFVYTKTLNNIHNYNEIQIGDAVLLYETQVVGNAKKVLVEVLNADGICVKKKTFSLDNDGKAKGEIVMKNARLWSPETPYLYTVRSSVKTGKGMAVLENMKIGIKTVKITKEHGFQLNGQTRKIKGVCLHHDLGPLGAAVNRAALIRQVKTLKDMGCDAIRTSHNMPSTMQMEVYDSLGMMVMAESFDMWNYPKCKNGYNLFFNEWADRDIENLVLNHRNHASNIMWSIGNEIPEQTDKNAVSTIKRLQNICHRLDPSRMVTSGMDKSTRAIESGFAQALDVPGYNYRLEKYEEAHNRLPQGFLLGSETASTVSSRGVYKFPVVKADNKMYDDGQCNGYDMECCWWSNLPDDDWYWQEKDWVIGEFVWTGYDYLGEPTPYDEYWPSRSSYFGIIDLAGLPKDRFYLYRSHWNKEKETIHLLPHWNFPERIGQTVPVYCYTNYPKAELFVNGISQGIRTKSKNSIFHDYDKYRLRWNDVKYQPGELKVVVYDMDGKKAGEKCIKTAGDPYKLKLEADKTILCADGDDIAFITISMMDKDGNFCATAQDNLSFSVEGAGVFQACCNGDATSTEIFTEPKMKLFNGQLVVLIKSIENKSGTDNKPAENFKCSLLATKESSEARAEMSLLNLCRGATDEDRRSTIILKVKSDNPNVMPQEMKLFAE
ncbi:MAG: DUF4982 domain-containing protein [Prevotella sp.]|nr:DUF4982 domain-containing protein [Candidatus Equicola stercoris]